MIIKIHAYTYTKLSHDDNKNEHYILVISTLFTVGREKVLIEVP